MVADDGATVLPNDGGAPVASSCQEGAPWMRLDVAKLRAVLVRPKKVNRDSDLASDHRRVRPQQLGRRWRVEARAKRSRGG
jgi:hypothetical protein